MKVLFDIDDFNNIQEILSQEEKPMTALDISKKLRSSESFARKHEIYYYLLRNSALFAIDKEDDELTVQTHEQNLFQSFVVKACSLAEKDYLVSNTPTWIENIYDEVFTHCKDEQLKKIIKGTTTQIKTLESVGITVNKEGVISFSLLTKSFYKNYLILLFTIIENWNLDSPEENDKAIFNHLFPYFLHYYNPIDLRLTALPRIRIADEEIYGRAKRLAHYQSMFNFLHEIGHFAFNHIGNNTLKQNVFVDGFKDLFDKKENYKEYEADAVATHILQNFPDNHLDDIYLAIHCMFNFNSTVFRFRDYIHEKDKTENIFQKRYKVLSSVPSTRGASDDTRTLMKVITSIFDRFVTMLYTLDRNQIEDKIAYYTEHNEAQKTFDEIFNI